MRIAASCLAVMLGLASSGAPAQATGDAVEKLRACSVLAQAERLECLEKLSRDIAPPPSPPSPSPSAPSTRPAASPAPSRPPAADSWVVSETTSPVDYTPIATATAWSGGGPDGTMQLSIQCRGGRMDLVIAGVGLTRRAEDYLVSYAVDGGAPVAVSAGPAPSGTGVAIRADAVRLLTSLPDRGEVAFRVSTRQGAALEGRYALASLKTVLSRLAAPCQLAAAPRN
jgi:hypothetical protein